LPSNEHGSRRAVTPSAAARYPGGSGEQTSLRHAHDGFGCGVELGQHVVGGQDARHRDGYFWFLGRTDDVIKTSGYRVGPYELETVIRLLEPVKDVSVTGVPDGLRGQSIKAWVELAPGYGAGAGLSEEIVAHVKENFSRFAYPRFIEYVDELPKSATGKVQRAQLGARR
jgi:acyl-coenzyme A synthetase/AMP-(fatty) acid ligase